MQSGFNPKARWDRHIPETDGLADSGELNERIEVLAWFRQAKIHPRRFIWKGRIYKVREINYNWQERRGQEVISCFSVNTGIGFYQISLNNTSLSWRIEKIIA